MILRKLVGCLTLKRSLLLLLWVAVSSFIRAQDQKIDSLLAAVQKQSNDTNKVKTLNKLSWQYFLQGNFPETEKYARQAIALANQTSFIKGKAEAINNIGNINAQLANYPKAIQYYHESLALKQQIGDKKAMAATYNNIGNVLRNQSRLGEAITYHLKALKIREEVGNEQGIAQSYSNIGLIFLTQQEFDKALSNFQAALKIQLKLNDVPNIGISYNNIGVVYYETNKYKQAIETQHLAAKYRQKMDDKFGLAQTYFNIGLNYFKLKQVDSSEKYSQMAFGFSQALGDITNMSAVLDQTARLALYKHNIKKAEADAKLALTYAKQTNNKALLRDAWAVKATIDSTKKDWSNAYTSMVNCMAYRDSVATDENSKKVLQTQLQYEFDKKTSEAKLQQDKKDALVREQQHRQKIIIWSVCLGLVLVVVFAVFILKALKTTRQQNIIIEQQKRETETQKHLIEEKHREITDSINYAERIQRSFLATKELLDQNLNEYFVLFKPKDIVSGDFYWATKLNNGHFVLVTADSTGHGVPGAIMSILNISCLENAVKSGLTQPAQILNNTRSEIIERLKKDGSKEGGNDGMDASLIDLHPTAKQLSYAAANNPVLILRKGEVLELPANKMPIGKHSGASVPFTQNTIELQKGDMIYTFTDGFPDQFGGPKGKKFKYTQFKQVLLDIYQKPLSEQKEILNTTLINWKGTLEQIDDICVVGIRV